MEKKANQMTLRWESPAGLPFPMPVDVQIGDTKKRYELTDGTVTIPVAQGQNVTVDPQGWILKEQ